MTFDTEMMCDAEDVVVTTISTRGAAALHEADTNLAAVLREVGPRASALCPTITLRLTQRLIQAALATSRTADLPVCGFRGLVTIRPGTGPYPRHYEWTCPRCFTDHAGIYNEGEF